MMKTIIIFLLLSNGITAFAQSKATAFEIETDPIAFALKGYSLHGIYKHNRLRIDLGVFGITQPEGFTGTKGYEIKTKGVGMKVNFLLNRQQTFFAGIGSGFSKNKIIQKATGEQKQQQIVSAGVHFGYRWFLLKNKGGGWKNLYLAPWVSVDRNFETKKPVFSAGSYQQQAWTFFPTVHIGYSF